jgi:microcystin-dependent protein
MTHVCKHIISLKEEDGSYRTLIDEEMPNVPFAEYASSRPSAGTVAIWCGPESTIPPCWSKCDGASLSIPSSNGANKALYDAIGKTWGGDAYSFRRPDMNGVFLRGVDGNAGVDPNKTGRTAVQSGGNTGNAIGSYQSDDFKSHTHTYTDMGTGRADCDDDGADRNFIDVTSTSLYTTSEQANGGTETRPANVAVYYIIYSCSE